MYKKFKRFRTKKRIPDKYQPLVSQLKENRVKNLDLTGAGNYHLHTLLIFIDFDDFWIMKISEMLPNADKMTSLKLVKNKSTDEGTLQLVKGLASNKTLKSLNLT